MVLQFYIGIHKRDIVGWIINFIVRAVFDCSI